MQQKVLVGVDFGASAPWAAGYAVKLASRLKLPLVFMGVAEESSSPGGSNTLLPESLDETKRRRLELLVQQCHDEGVGLEILLTSGPFFQNLRQLLTASGNFKFLVVGVPREGPLLEDFLASLKELHRLFRGEILLVREQGRVARFADLKPRKQRRNS